MTPTHQSDVLSAEDIVHVVPDGKDPEYHWLYVKSGYAVKYSVKSGQVVQSRELPTLTAITAKVKRG